VSVERDRHG
jgi:hypothetical protein